jgi:hypothetical protein
MASFGEARGFLSGVRGSSHDDVIVAQLTADDVAGT